MYDRRMDTRTAMLLATEIEQDENDDRPAELRKVYARAARLKWDSDDVTPYLSELKRARVANDRAGWTTNKQGAKRRWYASITEQGYETLKSGDAIADQEVEQVGWKPPVRVGCDHMLSSTVWRAVMSRVRTGELDLLIVRPGTAAKVGYWDE